jgi:phospholipase C
MEVVNLLKDQPQIFGSYQQFLDDCDKDRLPDYSFIEPNYTDHEDDSGEILASDQHPDHNVQEGERLIASIYNAIKKKQSVWESTALLVVYDEHGGIYDHVVPPPCMPDGFVAQPRDTGTGRPFTFDRLGVRVPAVLISPWIPRGTVVSPLASDGTVQNPRIFEHACIPATITKRFMPDFDRNPANKRSVREQNADTFLDLLSLSAPRTVDLEFDLGD